MEYRLPTYDDEKILKDYVSEHYANYERSISASNELTSMNYKEWVDKINRNTNIPDDDWGKYYLYLVFDNNKLIGLLNIRFELPIDYRNQYGDIGYGVRPSERRKGYATKMLKYALSICKEKGMNEVIVGCYKDNFGSNKTILKNNGMLYRTTTEDLVLSDKWAITLDNNYYKITL
jgi:predicted acetyltransferase